MGESHNSSRPPQQRRETLLHVPGRADRTQVRVKEDEEIPGFRPRDSESLVKGQQQTQRGESEALVVSERLDADHDKEGSAWARERQERRAEALRAQALRAQAAWAQRRREEQDELRTEVWLSGAAGRRIRAAAARAGLTPHEVVAQLTKRVSVGEDGTLSVAPFVPGHMPRAVIEER
ncbi:hypothetical protein ACFV6B_28560 [Streptomyces microflavus]|uniref:hypothetical protein n=1 Tax=Streptomyces microflavus TaxID=1919 RepID=UPI0036609ADF